MQPLGAVLKQLLVCIERRVREGMQVPLTNKNSSQNRECLNTKEVTVFLFKKPDNSGGSGLKFCTHTEGKSGLRTSGFFKKKTSFPVRRVQKNHKQIKGVEVI